jgi:hypothetical protein
MTDMPRARSLLPMARPAPGFDRVHEIDRNRPDHREPAPTQRLPSSSTRALRSGSPSSISGSGDRPPNKKIISALKLRRVVLFERVDE